MSYPSLYADGATNRYPVDVQARHMREAQERVRLALTWALNRIATLELGEDYRTIPPEWDTETVKQYEYAMDLAVPNAARLHR